jgi:hypothetical protein
VERGAFSQEKGTGFFSVSQTEINGKLFNRSKCTSTAMCLYFSFVLAMSLDVTGSSRRAQGVTPSDPGDQRRTRTGTGAGLNRRITAQISNSMTWRMTCSTSLKHSPARAQ